MDMEEVGGYRIYENCFEKANALWWSKWSVNIN